MILKTKEIEQYESHIGIVYNEMIDSFNKVAREIKSKYYMNITNLLPSLHKNIVLWIGDSLGESVILYNEIEGYFYFYEGIDKEVFEEIKLILEKLKQCFFIEVR